MDRSYRAGQVAFRKRNRLKSTQAGQLLETEDGPGQSPSEQFHHEEFPMLFPTGAPEADVNRVSL